jgi:hypothetical protein
MPITEYLEQDEVAVLFKKCHFILSDTENVQGLLIITEDRVLFLETSGIRKKPQNVIHDYELMRINRVNILPEALAILVEQGQNKVYFNYSVDSKGAKQISQTINSEKKRIRAEHRRRAAQEKRKEKENRRKDRISKSIRILDESFLESSKFASMKADFVNEKRTDLLIGEFDFISLEVSSGGLIQIDFTTITADRRGFNVYLFSDVGVKTTLSGGISEFARREALWSALEVTDQIQVVCQVLQNLNLWLVVSKHVGSGRAEKKKFSVQVKTWNGVDI